MDELKKFGQVVKGLTADEGELALINAQALRPLSADEVFVFRVAACDDQVDRDYERFTENALKGLAKLMVGRTMLFDHVWSADKQAARIYAAGVEQAGEVKRLVLRVYMLRSEQTAPVIAAIEGGILREVSIGCAVAKATCSVCGANRFETYCGHLPGREYEGQTCHVDLDDAMDAYECSFVAVPAQPGAGVIKRYGGAGEPPEGSDIQTLGDDEALIMAKARQELEEKRFGGINV